MQRAYLIAGAVLCVLAGAVLGFIGGGEIQRHRANVAQSELLEVRSQLKKSDGDKANLQEVNTKLKRELNTSRNETITLSTELQASQKTHLQELAKKDAALQAARLAAKPTQLTEQHSTAIAKYNLPGLKLLGSPAAEVPVRGAEFSHNGTFRFQWNAAKRCWEATGVMQNNTGTDWRVANFSTSLSDAQGGMCGSASFMITEFHDGQQKEFSVAVPPLNNATGIVTKAEIEFLPGGSVVGSVARKQQIAEEAALNATPGQITPESRDNSSRRNHVVGGFEFTDCVLKPLENGCLLQGKVRNATAEDARSAYFDVTIFDQDGGILDVVQLAIDQIKAGNTREFSEDWISHEGRELTRAASYRIAVGLIAHEE